MTHQDQWRSRGHSAVRSNSSSHAYLIGKVYDHSSGYRIAKAGELAEWMENAGQYHGCGVSKPSMGAVIWNVQWGDDACYEAHASQPRATFDRPLYRRFHSQPSRWRPIRSS